MYKILIVDDEPMVIHGLCSQIDWEAYNLKLVGTADSGISALSILKQKTIDILFTDVRMPKMDGLSLIKTAKQINPFIRSIIISSHSEFDYVKKALLLGVENYLLKPIDQRELDKTIQKTIDNLNRDRINVQKNTPDSMAFRNNILDRWVNGAIQDYEFYERAGLLNINLHARQYQISVIDITGYDTESRKIACAQSLLEKCRNSFSPAFKTESFIDGFNRVVNICCGEGLETKRDELESIVGRITASVPDEGIRIFAGIGPVMEGMESVAHNYTDAVEYLNYRYIDPDALYIFYGELIRGFNLYGCGPTMVQFAKALSEEDLTKTCTVARKQLDICSGAPIKTVKELMIPYLITLIKQMNESGHTSVVLPGKVTIEFSELGSIDAMECLAGWFLRIISQSIEEMGRRKKSLHLLVQRTLEIVKKDYHRTDLMLNTIAAELKVSSAYLGQLFKEETGKYYNDYLTEVRLQASKTLLLETDLKIREILFRIGMTNQSYYNKVFKKAYGISPLSFRYQKGCGHDIEESPALHN